MCRRARCYVLGRAGRCSTSGGPGPLQNSLQSFPDRPAAGAGASHALPRRAPNMRRDSPAATVLVAAIVLVAATCASADCTCLGDNPGFDSIRTEAPWNNLTLFPADYGKTCASWDQTDCIAQWPDAISIAGWCCDSWCYVDSSCEDAQESSLVPGLYWATNACTQPTASCPYECACTGSNTGFPFSDTAYSNRTLFPTNYGQSCTAWEKDYCAEMCVVVPERRRLDNRTRRASSTRTPPARRGRRPRGHLAPPFALDRR